MREKNEVLQDSDSDHLKNLDLDWIVDLLIPFEKAGKPGSCMSLAIKDLRPSKESRVGIYFLFLLSLKT